MAKLEDQLNWLSDRDWTWFPFLSLRPAKTARMTNALVAKIALAFGPLFGFSVGLPVMVVALRVLQPLQLALRLGAIVATFTALLFVVYRLSFAACWNERAERLARVAQVPPSGSPSPTS